MTRRIGFTLIEVLLVVGILAILAAVVVPQILLSAEDARPAVMAVTAKHIRDLIEYHASVGDVPLSDGGYPGDLDATWFMHGRMPKHVWTNGPLIVKVEDKGEDDIYPEKKTFNLGEPGKKNAWYNPSNGAFCVRVPEQGNDEESLALFNFVNNTDATSMDQTTR